MAGTTLTTLDAILKNQYLPPVREQLNNGTVTLSRLEKNYDSVVGKNFTIPLHYGRNEGIGARPEGAALPTAGAQGYKECIVPMRYQYGRIMLTGQTIKAAKTSEGAFIRAVESEMKGLTNDMRSSMNRQIFGDGSGLLATAASAATVNITVDSTAKLRVGMPVDIIVKSTGATSAGIVGTTVASITSGTVFVVANAPATPASVDSTYGVYLAGSRNLEMMGLGGIVSDADPASGGLQGLAVATYPWWKATVLGNGGTPRAISDTILQTAIDTVETVSSGKVSAFYTSFGVRRAYQGVLTALKQYVNTMELKGGYKALDFNGLPIIADKDAPAKSIFAVDEEQLQIFRLADADWMQEDGAILSRVSGYDAYEAVMYLYQELGTGARNTAARINDITEA